MSSMSKIEGLTIEEALNPPSRLFNYEDESAVRTFSMILRMLWDIEPRAPEAQSVEDQDEKATQSETEANHGHTIKDVYNFMAPLSHMSPEERNALQRHNNKEDWENDWRKAIAFGWNHVFWDVTRFLYNVNCTVGHWHCGLDLSPEEKAEHGPGYVTFVVSYPEPFVSGNKAIVLSFPTNVILLPMFVDKGIKIGVDRTDAEGAKQHLYTWNDDVECTEGLYLRKSVAVDVTLEEDAGESIPEGERKERSGVAGVFVYATMCKKRHSEELTCCEREFEEIS